MIFADRHHPVPLMPAEVAQWHSTFFFCYKSEVKQQKPSLKAKTRMVQPDGATWQSPPCEGQSDTPTTWSQGRHMSVQSTKGQTPGPNHAPVK